MVWERFQINLKKLNPLEHVVAVEWGYVAENSTRFEGFEIKVSYPPDGCEGKPAKGIRGCGGVARLHLPPHKGEKEERESAYRRDRLLNATRHLVSLCSGKSTREPF
jgi:hypothetical protein